MKKILNHTRWMRTLLALTLALALPMAASASQVQDTAKTEAVVVFEEGELELGVAYVDTLNLDFGTQPVPIAAVTYPAVTQADGHKLEVYDARDTSGEWKVTVALGTFMPESTSNGEVPFRGLITFADGTLTSLHASGSTAGLTLSDPIEVTSLASTTQVLVASSTAARGAYQASWESDKITLDISADEALKVQKGKYAAQLTWTLVLDPSTPPTP